MTVALFSHPAGLDHDTGPGHPECPARLRAVMQALEHPDFVPLLREVAPEATVEQLGRAHPPEYVRAILAIQPPPGDMVRLDGDTLMSHGSREAILRGSGAAVAGVDAVMEGWARAAFVATRPPGHHAYAARAGGHCYLNNAAIAAQRLRDGGAARVAVLDLDRTKG